MQELGLWLERPVVALAEHLLERLQQPSLAPAPFARLLWCHRSLWLAYTALALLPLPAEGSRWTIV